MFRLILASAILAMTTTSAEAELSQTAIRSALQHSVVRIEVGGVLATGQVGTPVQNVGTGFLISERGFLLTAHHLFLDNQGHPFAGTPTVKVFLESDHGDTTPLPVKYDDIKFDRYYDAALLKIPEPDENKYVPAPICRPKSLALSTTLTSLGYLGDYALAARSGSFDSSSGMHNYWQTGLQTTHGMSGGPVATPDAQVVGLIYGGQAVAGYGQDVQQQADGATLVIPLDMIRSLISAGGEALNDCTAPKSQPANDKITIQRQISDLYSPIYALTTKGAADFDEFREEFNARFGRYTPILYKVETVDGQQRRVAQPMSDPEWQVWMHWATTSFYPENQKIGNIINTHTDLLEGGVMTPCMKLLLRHFSAFEAAYNHARSDPKDRVWQPDHGWPACFEGEIEQTLARLATKQANAPAN